MHCRWADLPKVDADTAARAAKLRTQLTGDAAHQYSVEDPSGQQQAAEDDAAEGSKNMVTEVQRLRCMIDSINAATAVLPKVRKRGAGCEIRGCTECQGHDFQHCMLAACKAALSMHAPSTAG